VQRQDAAVDGAVVVAAGLLRQAAEAAVMRARAKEEAD
jgi:hypothetical protein